MGYLLGISISISVSAIIFIVTLLVQEEPSSSAIILSLKKRHGSSSSSSGGNQYSSSRPTAFQGNKSTCTLFLGTWVRDDSYPLYKPADCPAVVEPEFDCQMYGRPDSDYLKYRWQPQNCNLPTYVCSSSSSSFFLRLLNLLNEISFPKFVRCVNLQTMITCVNLY